MIRQFLTNHRENIFNFGWRSIQIIGKQGCTFLIFLMSAQLLNPEVFGIFNYLMALVGILMIFCDFGISASTAKFAAEYAAKNSKNSNQIFFASSSFIVTIASIISFIIILFGNLIYQEHYRLMLYLIPYLYFVPLSGVLDGIYRGEKKFKELSIISIIVGVMSLIISYFLIKTYFLTGAIIAQNILYILLSLTLYVNKNNISYKINKNLIKEIVKYSLIIGLTSIAYYLYSQVDILILKEFGYIKEIGYYSILTKVFNALMPIPYVIAGQILAPDITKFYYNGEYEKVLIKLKKYIFFCLTSGTLISIILYFLLPPVIQLFLIAYFTPETIHMLKLLLIINPLSMMAAMISQAHTIATGNAQYSLWTLMIAGIANVILNYYFIDQFGYIGVVYSTLICYTFATVSFIVLYYFKIKKLINKSCVA